ncbi:MAG: hypothetical protein M1335_04790, partial [Chloroflexi bacterium]|nr:hypothetical protein [Chloroflexota bacterium]
MPELPDVELARRRLLNEIVGKEIASFELVKTATKVRTLQDIAEEEFRNAVVGAAFEDLQRKGKFLIAPLDTGESIVFHFMLSGWLDFFPTEPGAEEKAARRAKLKFTFEDGSVLIFSDPRNMGRVFLVKSGDFESVGVLARMGIEPLGPDFTLDRFRAIFESHAGKTVKDLLRDQERIAGIGNIYSDEIMRRAGVRP